MEIGAVLTTSAEVAGAAGLVQVSRSAYHWLKDKARERKEVDEAKGLLGISRKDAVAYRHDSVHALYSGGTELHPDNLAALTTIAGNQFARARDIRQVTNVTTAIGTNLST